MSDEKNFENEELTTEEITEVVEETAEEAVEEIAEEAEVVYNEYEILAEEADRSEDSDEEGEIVFDEEAIADLKNLDGVNKSNGKLIAIVIGVIVALVIAAGAMLYFMSSSSDNDDDTKSSSTSIGRILERFNIGTNKYNKQYIDTTGRTIQDVADASGMTLEEFLEEYDLPSDMPEDTYESAAFYTMPAEKAAEIYGMTFDDLKQLLQLGDDVDPKDPWGEVEGEVALNVYVGGEEYVDQLKEMYGLGDEITGETKWKDIRPLIDAKQKEMREEQERLAAEAEANAALEESEVEADAVLEESIEEAAADSEESEEEAPAAE